MTDPDQRGEDARRRIEMAEAGRRAAAVEAQKLIDAFVAEAGRRGLRPVPLLAQTFNGRSVKTDKRGWYLNRSRSLGIGQDGSYYRLVVPSTPLARWTGVKLVGEPPPLVVGLGGRDGEGGDLADFLERILDGGAFGS